MAITPLERGPVSVEGVVNVRGDVVPVIDLRERLGLERVALSADQQFLVVSASGRLLALRVDAVEELVAIDDAQLRPPDLPGVARIAGLAAMPDGVVIVCDLLQFLDWEEAGLLDAALRATGAGT